MSETLAALGTTADDLLHLSPDTKIARLEECRGGGGGVHAGDAQPGGARPLLIPLLIVPAALTIRGLRQAQRVRLTGVAIAMALLVVAPWVIFNMTALRPAGVPANGDTGVLTGANCKETFSGRLLGSWFGLSTFSDYRMHDATFTLSRHATQSQAFRVHPRSSRSSPARGLGPRRSRLERFSSLPGRR